MVSISRTSAMALVALAYLAAGSRPQLFAQDLGTEDGARRPILSVTASGAFVQRKARGDRDRDRGHEGAPRTSTRKTTTTVAGEELMQIQSELDEGAPRTSTRKTTTTLAGEDLMQIQSELTEKDEGVRRTSTRRTTTTRAPEEDLMQIQSEITEKDEGVRRTSTRRTTTTRAPEEDLLQIDSEFADKDEGVRRTSTRRTTTRVPVQDDFLEIGSELLNKGEATTRATTTTTTTTTTRRIVATTTTIRATTRSATSTLASTTRAPMATTRAAILVDGASFRSTTTTKATSAAATTAARATTTTAARATAAATAAATTAATAATATATTTASAAVARVKTVVAAATTTLAPIAKEAGRARGLFLNSQGLICGGRDIHDILKKENPRTIPWASVFAVAQEFMKSQGVLLTSLGREATQLREAIPAAEAAEAPKSITDEQQRALINAAMAAPNSFGSLEAARASMCGYSRQGGGTKAFDAARAGFREAATQLFASGLIRSNSAAFRTFCDRLLSGGNVGNSSSSCGELCQDFASTAQGISDARAGALASTSKRSTQLRTEAEQKEVMITTEQAKLDSCKAATTDLQAFKVQLEGLEATIQKEHESFRQARDALYEELDRLDEVLAETEKHNGTLQALVIEVQGKNQTEQAVQALLNQAQANRTALDKTLKATEQALRTAQDKVNRTEAASVAAESLKSALSNALRDMTAYFEAAVRKPLATLGLSAGADIAKAFPEATSLPEAAATAASLKALGALCADEATQRAFAAVGDAEVKMGQLCEFGDVEQVTKELHAAVQGRINQVVEDLKKAQTWSDPYKGQAGMDAQRAEELVLQREPRGLREVITGYSDTGFYREYLSHWRVQEKFHVLYAKLARALQEAQAAQNAVDGALAQLRAQLSQAMDSEEQVRQALVKALSEHNVAKDKKKAAEATLNELVLQQKRLNDRVAALEAAAEAARLRWEAAKKALEETHKNGVGLVQLVQHLEQKF